MLFETLKNPERSFEPRIMKDHLSATMSIHRKRNGPGISNSMYGKSDRVGMMNKKRTNSLVDPENTTTHIIKEFEKFTGYNHSYNTEAAAT